MARIKETDLAEPVIYFFENLGFNVYSEVKLQGGRDYTADIVLEKNGIKTVIELKTGLTDVLISQALRWKTYANNVMVVIPISRVKRSEFKMEILENHGIGVLELDLKAFNEAKVENNTTLKYQSFNQLLEPKAQQPHTKYFNQLVLYEEHKYWAVAGSQSSSDRPKVSSYTLVMFSVYECLRNARKEYINDGWVTVKDLSDYVIANTDSRAVKAYSNIKQSIYQGLTRFETGDVKKIKVGRFVYFKIMSESDKYLL